MNERSELLDPGLRDWPDRSGVGPSWDVAPPPEPGRREGGGDGVFGVEICQLESSDGIEVRGVQGGGLVVSSRMD